jgi:hypothetical protein
MNKTLLTKGRKRSTVDIDGDKITLQELTLADSKALRANDGEDESTKSLRLIIASIVDEKGNKVYQEGDIPELETKVGMDILKKIGEAIAVLNGFTVEKKA